MSSNNFILEIFFRNLAMFRFVQKPLTDCTLTKIVKSIPKANQSNATKLQLRYFLVFSSRGMQRGLIQRPKHTTSFFILSQKKRLTNVVAFFEKSVLKEAGILCPLSPQ